MFEAKCPSCSSTYQVDERRVPAGGLKMRCPKCGESFQVAVPVHSEPPVLGAALGMQQPRPPARKQTMLGLADQAGTTPQPPPRPNRKTMLGVAPGKSDLELASLEDDALEEADADELDLTAASEDDYEELDLPAPSEKARRSTQSGPDSLGYDEAELDLPSPGRFSELPSSARELDLPSPASAGLPDLNAGLPDLGADLPDLGGDLPDLSGDLPDLGAGLPDLEAALPTVGGHLPLPAQGILPLPTAGILPLPTAGILPQRAGALPGLAGEEADLDGGDPFGDDPFGSASFGAGADSGVLGPPLELSAAPPRPAQGSEEALAVDRDDIFGQGPTTAPESIPPGRAAGGAGFGNVDLGGAEAEEEEFDAFPTEERESASAGGSAGYGDVSLDGGTGNLDLGDDVERPRAPEGFAAPAAATAKVELGGRGKEKEDTKEKKKRRKTSGLSQGTRIALGGILVLAVAGGALSLLPDVGPYGVYLLIDTLKADSYGADLEADINQARSRLAMDSSAELTLAFAKVDSGRIHAPRYRPRKAYAAYLGFLNQLRFGPGSSENAQAEVFLAELSEADPETKYLDLAQLAKKAASGTPGIAATAARQLSRGLDFAIVIGEAALRERNEKVSLQAWEVALKASPSARTHFGMARAYHLAEKEDEARKEIDLALEKNSKHAGARLLLASLMMRDRTLDEDIVESLTPIAEGKGVSLGEQVQAYIILGDLHLTRSRIKHAEESFSEALKLDSGSAAAQRGLAMALFEGGRHSEALARFEASLQKDPDDLGANLGLVQSKLQLEQLEDAVKHLQMLAQKHPKSSAVAYWIGRGKERIGEKKEAEQAYETAIKFEERCPELVLSYIALTRLLGQKGNIEEASTVIQLAERKFPDDPAVYEALGELSSSRGSFEEAVKDYNRALALDKNNIGLRFARGVALRQARRFDEAAADFDAVEKESQDYPGLALERGNLYEASGRSEEALKMYEAALAAAPDDPDLKLRVACGKASSGQSKPALELLAPVLEKRPNSAEVNFCQGLAILNGGEDFALAKTHLQRAVAGDATRARYHLYVGWVAMELKDYSLATVSLDRAIELDQTLPDAYWKRGELRVMKSQVQDALDDIAKALKLAPERLEAHAAAARAYMGLGKEQDALSEWKLAVGAAHVEPSWRYQYGQLLFNNRRKEEAREQLKLAITEGEKRKPEPAWLPEAHRFMAMAIGQHKEAIPHLRAYLEAKRGSQTPYLLEAAKALDAILKAEGF